MDTRVDTRSSLCREWYISGATKTQKTMDKDDAVPSSNPPFPDHQTHFFLNTLVSDSNMNVRTHTLSLHCNNRDSPSPSPTNSHRRPPPNQIKTEIQNNFIKALIAKSLDTEHELAAKMPTVFHPQSSRDQPIGLICNHHIPRLLCSK